MTSHAHEPDATTAHATRPATDPVCGMTVDPTTTSHTAIHDGEQYHFCSAGCKDTFVANPEQYDSH